MDTVRKGIHCQQDARNGVDHTFALKKKKKSFSSSRQRKNRYCLTGFPRGSVVKNLPVRQEAWVRSLSPEAPPEERTATHSSVLA